MCVCVCVVSVVLLIWLVTGHQVWNWDRTEKTLIYGPVDIEGHLGKDNRFYVIGTRCKPPPP